MFIKASQQKDDATHFMKHYGDISNMFNSLIKRFDQAENDAQLEDVYDDLQTWIHGTQNRKPFMAPWQYKRVPVNYQGSTRFQFEQNSCNNNEWDQSIPENMSESSSYFEDDYQNDDE